MTQFTRRSVVLAKIEATYGTDAEPTGAANAMMASAIEILPTLGESRDRDILYPELGASPAVRLNRHRGVRFAVEIAGSGAAATPPAYGPLWRACGLDETITPDTGPVEYELVSTGHEAATVHAHGDGTRHAMTGARGNLVLVFPGNGIAVSRFTFHGLYVAAAAASLPAPTFTGFKPPLPTGAINTPTFTLHGQALTVENLEIDLGNTAPHRDRIGSRSVPITNRRVTARLSAQAPAIGTKDFFAALEGDVLGVMQIVHGVGAGNIVQVDAPKVQIVGIDYADADGIRLLNMELLLTRDAGDDELVLTVK